MNAKFTSNANTGSVLPLLFPREYVDSLVPVKQKFNEIFNDLQYSERFMSALIEDYSTVPKYPHYEGLYEGLKTETHESNAICDELENQRSLMYPWCMSEENKDERERGVAQLYERSIISQTEGHNFNEITLRAEVFEQYSKHSVDGLFKSLTITVCKDFKNGKTFKAVITFRNDTADCTFFLLNNTESPTTESDDEMFVNNDDSLETPTAEALAATKMNTNITSIDSLTSLLSQMTMPTFQRSLIQMALTMPVDNDQIHSPLLPDESRYQFARQMYCELILVAKDNLLPDSELLVAADLNMADLQPLPTLFRLLNGHVGVRGQTGVGDVGEHPNEVNYYEFGVSMIAPFALISFEIELMEESINILISNRSFGHHCQIHLDLNDDGNSKQLIECTFPRRP